MELESTASQSFNHEKEGNFLTMNKYLINTSKALGGHKLRTKDFIKLQLLKFRRCSPPRYDDCTQLDSPGMMDGETRFRKFREFGVSQEEIHRIVVEQREKMSRETRGRIKLFNNTKINTMLHEDTHSNQLTMRLKPSTSHQSRVTPSPYYANKTISYETPSALSNGKRGGSKGLMFRSDNLDSKMNDYLNFYLYSQKKEDEKHEKQQQKRQWFTEERQNQTISVKQKTNVSFMRKMKKHHKVMADQILPELMDQFKPEQLVKPTTTMLLSKRQRKALSQNKQKLRKRYQQSAQPKECPQQQKYRCSLSVSECKPALKGC